LAKAFSKNYYKVLQVDVEACDEILEVAYKRLARLVHPDVNLDRDTTEDFKTLQEAYEVLTTDRARYDDYYKKVYAKVGAASVTNKANVRQEVSNFSHNGVLDIIFREIPDFYKNYSGSKMNGLLQSLRAMNKDISQMKYEIERLWWRTRG
jgi:DnaJ-class molecular chaperone